MRKETGPAHKIYLRTEQAHLTACHVLAAAKSLVLRRGSFFFVKEKEIFVARNKKVSTAQMKRTKTFINTAMSSRSWPFQTSKGSKSWSLCDAGSTLTDTEEPSLGGSW